jgi:acetyl esterase/lipase
LGLTCVCGMKTRTRLVAPAAAKWMAPANAGPGKVFNPMNRRQFITLTASTLSLTAAAVEDSQTKPSEPQAASASAVSTLDSKPVVLPLWPPPVEPKEPLAERERDVTKPSDQLIAGRPVIRLSHVSTPTLTIYRPTSVPATDSAVMVCPGGGYHVLAWDLEGTEICEWLNSLGITAGLLKYRVPRPRSQPNHGDALEDAQRGIRLLRARAGELGLDRKKIGALGFSAGAHLVARLSASGAEKTYPTVDAADDEAGRPNFLVLIYPAGLMAKSPGSGAAPEVAPDKQSPPTFIVITQDDADRGEEALAYAAVLKRVGVPVTLHFYPRGGHGYGLRRTQDLVTTWPERAVEWLNAGGWMR